MDKISLNETTLIKMEKVGRILNTKDKSTAIRTCINFAEKLLTEMDRGGTVYYETKKGRSFEILMPGES